MKEKIVIIGAGSTGLSTALELAKRVKGKYQIIVVEKQFVGAGQTGQCCGLVRHFYNTPEMVLSASESYKRIQQICENNPKVKYVPKGLLVLNSLEHKKDISENVELLKSKGVKAKYLESEELSTIYPDLETSDICAGFDVNAGYLNPVQVLGYLTEECQKLGVVIKEHSPVKAIRQKGEGFEIVTSNESIIASKVFNATAAATNILNSFLDLHLPVQVINITNCFYRLPAKMRNTQIAIADFVNLFYFIPHPEYVDVSTVALDLTKQIDPRNAGEYPFRYKTINAYTRDISKRLPNFSDAVSVGGFDSCIDVTSDYYPIVGKTDIPNYYCASGFSGTGFKHFPVLGTLMAEEILDEKPTYPELVSFFSGKRFKNGVSTRQNVSDSYFVTNNQT